MAVKPAVFMYIWIGLTGAFLVTYITLKAIYGGVCPEYTPLSDFDREQYLGRWYEMYRADYVTFESGDCGTANYKILPQNFIEVVNISYDVDTKANDVASGSAQCSFWRPGLCGVKFS